MSRAQKRPRCKWCGGNAHGTYAPNNACSYGWSDVGFCSLKCAERFAMAAIIDGYTPSATAAEHAGSGRPYQDKALKKGKVRDA